MPIVSTLDDLRKLLELCREQRVESCCVDGISVKFDPTAFAPAFRRPVLEHPAPLGSPLAAGVAAGVRGAGEESAMGAGSTGKPPFLVDGQPVDDKTLFWSSG